MALLIFAYRLFLHSTERFWVIEQPDAILIEFFHFLGRASADQRRLLLGAQFKLVNSVLGSSLAPVPGGGLLGQFAFSHSGDQRLIFRSFSRQPSRSPAILQTSESTLITLVGHTVGSGGSGGMYVPAATSLAIRSSSIFNIVDSSVPRG